LTSAGSTSSPEAYIFISSFDFPGHFTPPLNPRSPPIFDSDQPNSKMTIPVATEVRESAVIAASIDDLWNLIQLPNVASFWTNLKEVQSSANVTKWTFHDGTVLDVKQEEHSVRQIVSEPPTPRPGSQIGQFPARASTADRFILPFVPEPRDRQIAEEKPLISLPTEHRSLHHVLCHQRPAGAELLERRLDHPAVPSHVRRPRGEHVRRMVGQFLQRRCSRCATPLPHVCGISAIERMRDLTRLIQMSSRTQSTSGARRSRTWPKGPANDDLCK
jgi:hypothetical protein